jgi:hypothetical protein
MTLTYFILLISHVKDMALDHYGNYVLQKTIDNCDLILIGSIVEEMKGHIFDLAKNKYGSLVLHKIINRSESNTFEIIVEEMKGHIFDLA